MKPRYKRRLFWAGLSVIAILGLSVVFVPPFINLNKLKPKLESNLTEQTGMPVYIDGDINFSLIGNTTIVAHNIRVQNGTIDSVTFDLPMSAIFDLRNAKLPNKVTISGALIYIQNLNAPKFTNEIEVKNSVINYKNKYYEIISGNFSNGLLQGTVRTNQHKYEFDSNADEFHIKNKANNLFITGHLYSDGSAHGTLSIDTDKLNEWFEFSEPKLNGQIKLTMNFDWDGNYGFKFSDIQGDNFSGNIELLENGSRNINLTAENIDLDFSFLMGQTSIFYDTVLNLDLRGNIKLGAKTFQHVKIDATGTKSEVKINNITADDFMINGGLINADGAKGLALYMNLDGVKTSCLFYGNTSRWACSEFTYGAYYGSLSVKNSEFEIFANSKKNIPSDFEFAEKLKSIGSRGKIFFQFADAGGSIEINNGDQIEYFDYANNKTLDWLDADLQFLPSSLRNDPGDFSWKDGVMSFVPYSKQWQIQLTDSEFSIIGNNAKNWFAGMDLRFVKDLGYKITGKYKNKNIADLEIDIAGQRFTGSASGNNVTLKTNLLNLDAFTNQLFIDRYEEQQFLTNDPLLAPFFIGKNISLSADAVIYNGDEFKNFVYSIKDNSQSFSVTDKTRGNMLASVKKDQNKYEFKLQLNNFAITDKLLSAKMPLNISDTHITADINLNTSGRIAFDIWNNLSGTMDLSFDGGKIYGFGIDAFYANADKITILNAENMLGNTLETGASDIKKIHIIGKYSNGNFETTRPLTLSMRHTDASGHLQINSGKMSGRFALLMRGTAPSAQPISIDLFPNGKRSYSLSQIMIGFDPDYLREFTATHEKF